MFNSFIIHPLYTTNLSVVTRRLLYLVIIGIVTIGIVFLLF